MREAVREVRPAITVLVAENAARGLRLLQNDRHDFAAVLLDLALPDLPGLELLMDLRAAAETKRIPVVVLTRSELDADLWASYKAGANAYVVKALPGEALVRQLRLTAEFWCNHNVRVPGLR
ncbi:response regulator [Mitsuaria sp. CC2]|uniref:response regulator n=1 Tax=Mitsuaria sp. CC2 TaxID=3029186 RepID=UPI003BA338FE